MNCTHTFIPFRSENSTKSLYLREYIYTVHHAHTHHYDVMHLCILPVITGLQTNNPKILTVLHFQTCRKKYENIQNATVLVIHANVQNDTQTSNYQIIN